MSTYRHADAETFAAVSQLLAEYADASDLADFEKVADIFADADVIGPDGSQMRGRDTIVSVYSALHPGVRPGEHTDRPITKRIVTGVRVYTTDDPDLVELRASYASFIPGTDGPVLSGTGRYAQELRRRDGEWRVTRHQIIHDLK